MTGDVTADTSGTFPVNEWMHVAATYDGTALRLYVNGELRKTVNGSGTLISSSHFALRIGSLEWSNNFAGAIDDVRLYDRALSQIEIDEIVATPSKAVQPTFSIAAGTYFADQTVVITGDTGSAIHYTQNGLDPTEADPVIASGVSVTIDQSQVLKARAFPTGSLPSDTRSATFTMKVPSPSISPGPGAYAGPQTVSISGVANVSWHYTTDGTTPTESSTQYTTPITITPVTTLRVVGFRTNWTASNVGGGTYSSPTGGGLKAAWGFQEGTGTTAFDVSGYGHVGALLNAPSWIAGRIGGGITFDGVDDRIAVPHSTALDFTTGLTMSLWVKVTSEITHPVLLIDGPGYSLQFNSLGWTIAAINLPSGLRVAQPITRLPINKWVHVAGTFDGAKVRLYIDGELVAIDDYAAGSIVASTNDLSIGSAVAGNHLLPGVLDEIRIYDRPLSQAEILDDVTRPVAPGTPLEVTARSPAAGELGVRSRPIAAAFGVAMDPASLTTSTLRLETLSGSPVPATVAYDAATRTATLTPSSPLTALTGYRVTVSGGAQGVMSLLSETLAADATWTFTTAASSLVGVWSLNEGSGAVATDTSGNGNHGAVKGGPAWIAGLTGQALSLDGSNDGIEVPSSDTLNPTNAVTMSAWIRLAGQPAGYQTILWKQTPFSGVSYLLTLIPGGFVARLTTTNGDVTADTSGTFPVNEWMHVAATYDGTALRLYINGDLRATANGSGTLISSSYFPLRIGSLEWSNALAGDVDEVRLYDRALTPAEITDLADVPEPPAQTAGKVAGGVGHTLLVKPDGTAWAWGKNGSGQLGENSIIDRKWPIVVPGLSNVVAVAAGGNHSMALTSGGVVYVWGENSRGQVGNASTIDQKTPVALSLSSVTAIAAGDEYSVALLTNGDVYAWGRNFNGQFGNGVSGTAANTNSTPVQIASGVAAITTGLTHTILVKTDGTVWGAGSNNSGQLGNGSTTQSTTWVQMTGIANAVGAAGGDKHTVILLADGTLKAAGLNTSGQLGDNATTSPRTTAVAVAGLTNVTQIDAMNNHTLATKLDGTVWAWGINNFGQLGDNGQSSILRIPTAIAGLVAASVAAGSDHSVAVTPSGKVLTWGRNQLGQLGDGNSSATISRLVPGAISDHQYAWNVATPQFSPDAGTSTVNLNVAITSETSAATIRYTLNGVDPVETDLEYGGAVLIDSSLVLKARAWKSGMPASNVASASYVLQPAQPTVSPAATTYTAPQTVTFSTTTAGAAIRYTTDGSAPTESSTLYAGPFQVATTTTFKIAAFKAGWAGSTVRTSTYTMNFGTLSAPVVTPATGTYTGQVSVEMSSPQPGAVIRYTITGGTPSASSPIYTAPFPVAVTTTVRAKAFHPDYTSSPETSAVFTITAGTPTLTLSSGVYAPGTAVTISGPEATATLRMTLDGSDPTATSGVVLPGTTIFAGAFTIKVRAFRTGALDSAVAAATYSLTGPLGPGAVAAGGLHTVMATTDGRVYAWGENGSGQVGDGTATDRTTSTMVQTLTGVTALTAGFDYTLARTWDGQVYAWGANGSGRLGDGTTTARNRPVPVTTLANIVALTAGDAHSLALTSAGQVYAWGENVNGQLGLGYTSTFVLVPTLVPALSNVVAIASGDDHNLAVTATGQVYAWGANGSSRLGAGTTTARNTPVLLNLTNVVAVAAGAAHSVALTDSGAVYAWGEGSSGQLATGSTTDVTTPTLVAGLHASAIAAGDNHTAAVRGDGVLLAWGANASGQIGDGTITQRNLPTAVSGPASVSTLSLGDLHTVAVNPDGSLWTWGEGLSGRLGDGLLTDRPTPQAVITALADWVPAAPTVSAASGTWTTAQSVTVASPTAAAVLRYSLDGVEPTDTSAEVPVGGVVAIDYSALFRARAFVSGRFPGAIARASYELQSAAPSISPGSGTYPGAQAVTLSVSGPPSQIRYTLDGTEPTATSALYVDPVPITTGLTLKARGFPLIAWSPSPTSSATYVFNYGVLDAPVASPAGGIYGSGQTVTLTAAPDTTIRYTLNGTDPTAASALYAAPIEVASGAVTVKARAFHPDWTESAVQADTYTIDTVPPTITAQRFPLPMGNWHRTPVTISFQCADNAGIATCSSPATISLEGAAQLVTGTAVDQVGLQATVQETVNVDLTPPVVTLTAPADGLVTASTSVVVTGAVSDALSGLAVVNCNGVATPVVDGLVSCSVPLRPGRNAVTLSARDVAGHSASAGVMVTLAGTPTRLTLTPAARTMLVEEVGTLSLRDDFGVPAPGATWTSSDPAIVSLSTDDPPVLTALAAGVATVTATANGLSSVSTITVVAGTSLADGTTRWTVAPTPVPNSSWYEAPIYTHRIDATGPDVFMVETNTTTWERTLRAIGPSGEVDWLATVPGVPLMGDMYGGVVAGVEPLTNTCLGVFNQVQRCYNALVRFAGPAGTATWRYDSPGLVDRPAQGPDGTIYVVEHTGDYLGYPNDNGTGYFGYPGEKSLVILDGATGAVTARVPLEGNPAYEPHTIGPIVGGDGFGYLLVTKGTQITLRKLSREGQVASETIVNGTCTTNCTGPAPYQLLPDGIGGLLITANWSVSSQAPFDLRLTRLDGAGGRTDTPIAGGNSPGTLIELIGQGGTAYLRQTSGATTVSQPVMDIPTWTPRWSLPLEWSLLAASPDGGAVAQNAAGDLARFDGTGQLLGTTPTLSLRNPVQELGGWIGQSADGLHSRAGTADDATRWDARRREVFWNAPEQYGQGDRKGNLAQRSPGMGVFAKTHYALHDYSAVGIPLSWALRFRHVSIRIVPLEQGYWFDQMGSAFSGIDPFGNWFFTLGAGMGDSDTSTACSGGPLKKGISRTNDVGATPVDPLERLAFPPSQERQVVERLLTRHNAYDNSLPYNCFPEGYDTFSFFVPPNPGTWNSNSFAAGLIQAAGLPTPRMPRAMFRLFPGWATPVPLDKFQ